MARTSFRVPGYRVEQLLGAGSSGEVWRASVTSTGVPVALKRIWLSERGQRESAIAEAAMLSTLDHPHLMKLHKVHRQDDAVVLALDLAAAGSLADLLARRGRLTVGEVITAIAPIGGALAYAHTAGVVHGDVSAANILFTDIGLPLLADLGVARLLGDWAPARTTPSYIDPMVAAGAVPVAASDLFMLAGVALHALTGAPPWQGDDARRLLESAAGEDPDFAGRLAAANVPPAVSRPIVRALDLDPARRGTTTEFALELRHAAEPVAVELSAGRSRHAAARPIDSWPLESVPALGTPAQSSAPVPPFARLPLTDGVRAPAPFAPAGRHHARGTRRTRRWPIAVAASVAVALAVALAVTAAVRWSHDPVAPHAAAHPVPTLRTPPTTTNAPDEPAASPAVDEPSPRTPPPARRAGLRATLVALDALRARAFATRDPALLRGVYASPALLARDRAMLLSIVPAGCGLRGVRTTFGALAVSPGLRVRTTTALAPSTLVCGGTRSGTAAGRGPRPVTVELVRSGGGYRIAAVREQPRPG